MDHKASYAHHIAQAIRHKKAMQAEPKNEELELSDLDNDMGDELPPEVPVDSKAARKERIKAILAR